MATPLVDLCAQFYPLHRTLVSDGMDAALALVARAMPVGFFVERYRPGKPVWTWKVPERWVVNEASLAWPDGVPICDFADHPLHLVSYSIPFEGEAVPWEKLKAHLHVGPERFPDALPWEFKYYERSWGFCLTWNQHQKLLAGLDDYDTFRVRIRTEFRTGPTDGLAVGVAVVQPRAQAYPRAMYQREIVVCADLCHPYQVNDSITGVVAAIELARRLVADPLPPRSRAVRFLFVPEVIGSICYLAHHEDLIPLMDGAVFAEMLGTPGALHLQASRGGYPADRISGIAERALWEHAPAVVTVDPHEWRPTAVNRSQVYGFRDTRAAQNDEVVFNGPGVDIPTVAFARYPYPEYHTSADAPGILDETQMVHAIAVLESTVRMAAMDWVPRRAFRGPLFLSGYGLWVDWRTDRALNAQLERLMFLLEGDKSIFDISVELGLPFQTVYDYVERLRTHGLVEALL